ncbi:MAG: amidase [Acidobacteriota bacterium]|nr:amidase [Acidobacteriota bacterium]
MDRRTFLAGSMSAAAALASAAPATFPVEEATIDSLRQGLASKQLTAHSLTKIYLSRIATLDKQLRSVIEINPDALNIASALDREPPRGPLHGIPILIKDNIDTADRMQTTAGSLALLGSKPARDAGLVERLRKAGAVLLGKTNLSEWANFRSTHSTSGWSGRGGQTRNPYALDRNPCGSSSGTGAAVSANLCAIGIGTETDGSVVCPSSMNGLVGIKPTVGLISGAGIVPISHTQDTAGPMTRTVRDAAVLLSILAEKGDTDYTKFLDPNGLRGARIGVARKFFGITADTDRVMENCLAELKRQGAEVIDPADIPTHGQFSDPEFELLLWEFKTDLNKYFASRPDNPVHSLAELIAFNEKHRADEMPHFEQEILIKAEAKGPLTDKTYIDLAEKLRRLSRTEGIDAIVAKHKLDAIVGPTAGPAWVIDWINGDHDTGGCSTPAAVAGYPHITVPAGFVQGLPVGLSFFGPAWSEGTLLKLAYGFEQATKARRPPKPGVHLSAA